MIGLKVNTQFQISLLFGLHPFVIWLLYFSFQIFEVKVNSSSLMGLFLSFSVCFHYSLNHSEPENLTSLEACFFNLMQLKFNLWPQAIKILLFHPLKDRAFLKKTPFFHFQVSNLPINWILDAYRAKSLFSMQWTLFKKELCKS